MPMSFWCGQATLREGLEAARARRGVTETPIGGEDLEQLANRYLGIVNEVARVIFPSIPSSSSWVPSGPCSVVEQRSGITYRRLHHLPDSWARGQLQAMVFGNRGETSATGVAFTGIPPRRKKALRRIPAQCPGEDVVAGSARPAP